MKDNFADTVVIGAGIVGSSVALRLAEKGQKVILLDKGRVGEEASLRNTGGVRQQDRDPAELPMAMEAVKIWAEMKHDLDCDVRYRKGGNLMIACSEKEMNYLRDTADAESASGLDVELLSPKETREINPVIPEDLEILGSKLCPTDGMADPLITVKAICRAARRKGVKIYENEPVQSLKAENGRIISAVSDRREFQGAYFVNAAGPWAMALCNSVGIDYPAALLKGVILITEKLPYMVEQYVSVKGMLYCQTLEGNILIGIGSDSKFATVFEKGTSLSIFKEAGKHVPKLLSTLKNVNVLRTFAGLDHVTPDSLPIIDKIPGLENFFLAAPLAGHGFCLGPVIGRSIAEWIVEGKSSLDLREFSISRFGGKGDFDDFTLEPSGFLVACRD